MTLWCGVVYILTLSHPNCVTLLQSVIQSAFYTVIYTGTVTSLLHRLILSRTDKDWYILTVFLMLWHSQIKTASHALTVL